MKKKNNRPKPTGKWYCKFCLTVFPVGIYMKKCEDCGSDRIAKERKCH
jgi:rRNA maturation endonuclease Nob1